jgi:hypothetical protein
MRKQERHRFRMPARDVDEMHVDAVDRRLELRQRVEAASVLRQS